MRKTPVQVYFEPRDRRLLERLSRRLGLSRAETIREAVRRWAADSAEGEDPLLALVGSIDDPSVPTDLSTRHDEYVVTGYRGDDGVADEGGRGGK